MRNMMLFLGDGIRIETEGSDSKIETDTLWDLGNMNSSH